MSPAEFKKWQFPLSLFFTVPVDFEIVQCRPSNLRKGSVALSNFRVKGPRPPCFPHTSLSTLTKTHFPSYLSWISAMRRFFIGALARSRGPTVSVFLFRSPGALQASVIWRTGTKTLRACSVPWIPMTDPHINIRARDQKTLVALLTPSWNSYFSIPKHLYFPNDIQ